jgi:MYXO-CTERM domain-containing protein
MRKALISAALATTLSMGVGSAAFAQSNGTNDNGTTQTEQSDNSGRWGLAGLLGLAGLAGLARRDRRTDDRPAASRADR